MTIDEFMRDIAPVDDWAQSLRKVGAMAKTDREIELEKKLEIARKNLKEIGDAIAIYFRREHTKDFAEDTLMGIGIVVGQTEQALKEIKE